MPQDVARWKITTPDGVQYYFGDFGNGDTDGIEKNDNGTNVANTITAWYLLQVVSPTYDTVKFRYSNIRYSYENKAGEVINQLIDESPNSAMPLPQFEKQVVRNFMTVPKLQRIEAASGSISFFSNIERKDLPGDSILNLIKIYSSSDRNRPVKQFRFYHTNGSRLRLDGFEELSADSESSGNGYRFEYNLLALPDPNPFGTAINSQDLWGYYNGFPNKVLPQSYSIMTPRFGKINLYGADRHTDQEYMKAGILEKITYPTGGTTTFDFEANTAFTTSVGNFAPTPVGKGASMSFFPGQTRIDTFTVENPDPKTGRAVVSVIAKQMVAGCPISPNSGYSQCYTVSIEGINGTSFPVIYYKDGFSTSYLPAGTYKMVGQGLYFPRQPNDNQVYFTLNWTEYPKQANNGASSFNQVIGGLRIKRITTTDGVTNNIKRYLYNRFDDSTSSGILVNEPFNYASSFRVYTTKCLILSYQTYLQVKSYPLTPLLPTQNSTVGYQNVTELQGEHGENGKIEYTFSTARDYPDEIKNVRPYPPSASFDSRRGKLLKTVTFKRTSSGYLPVKAVSNSYQLGVNANVGFGLVVETDVHIVNLYPLDIKCPILTPSEPSNYYVSGYKTVGEFSYLEADTTRIYDQKDVSAYLETVNSYSYDTTLGYYQLWSKESKNSTGETLRTVYKHAYDVESSSNIISKSLLEKYIIEPVLEQIDNRNGIEVERSVTNYAVFPADQILPTTVKHRFKAYPLTDRLQYNSYNQHGRLLEQQKTGDIKEVFLWGYNSEYPVVRCVGTTYDVVKNIISQNVLDDPATTDETMRAELNKLRRNLPKALIFTYTYTPLIGMTSKTDERGVTTYYEYDAFNRLKIIRDQNQKIIKTIDYKYAGPGLNGH